MEDKPTVLVVEDEIFTRMAIVSDLREAGFNVMEAGDSGQALSSLAHNSAIQALITDINLPGSLNGLSLARYVRRVAPDVSVLIVSGARVPLDELPPGVRYFAKPYEVRQLVAALKQMVLSPTVV